ncbi:MAG: ABC transporter ATP-binding protein/permease [Clostridiales bacterium]|jgi:ATP-binding cassette subfamily B protein|nr:ABC transporter ATP-binding protein/permease [Clostridiales bacterium]
MSKLQKSLMLSDKGYSDLKKAVFACTLSNISMFPPFVVLWMFIEEMLKPLSGGAVSQGKLWILCAAAALLTVVAFFCHKNDYRKTYVASYAQSESTRITMAEHIRKLPMSLFNSRELSDLTTNIMGDVANNEHVLSHCIPQLFANAVSIFLVCAALSFHDWRMSLAVFVSVPLALCIILVSRKVQGSLARKHIEVKLKASGQTQEYIEGIKVIRACNMDGERFSALEKALRAMMRQAMKMEAGVGVLVSGASAVLQAGIGLTVFVGITLFTEGRIEFLPLLLFFLIAVKIYAPIIVLLTLLPEVFYFMLSARRMRDLMAIKKMDGSEEIPVKSFDITFENVSFSYNKDGRQAIRNMSVTIPQGGITALVGPSGSGKSTVARLAARFWDADSGCVALGGVDVKALDPEYLMSYMSFVFQDVVLFNDTVMNNIRIGKAEATDEEVYAAAKAACCDEFITKLPEGYHTMLGENGATLSGGERQRLSIARALLKDAPIILLDEATASLDPENEAAIQQAVSALIAGRTVLVIAHRLRTVSEADKIIVLDNGEALEQGSHQELMARGGLYSKLYALQRESQGWTVRR